MTDAPPPQPAAPQPAARAADLRKPAIAAAFTGLFILLIAVTVQKLWSADFWWQLKNGLTILETHTIPDQESWSHTARGTPVREMRWLYCAAIAWLWNNAGPEVIVLLKTALITAAFALIIWPVRRLLASPLVLAALGLALLAGLNRWVVRPELVTDLLTAAFLVILERTTREKPSLSHHTSRLIWLLPPLQVLWVNSHSTYIFGPILAWVFFAGDWATALIRRAPDTPAARPNLPLLAVSLLTTAACWINPYGHWGAVYALEMFRQTQAGHATAQIISEMRSPFAIGVSNWGWDHWCGAILCITAAATYIPIAKHAPLARLAVLVMALYLFATLQRNLGLVAVMLAWVTTRNAMDLAASNFSLRARNPHAEPLALAALGLLMAATGWYIATDRYAVSRGLPSEFGLGVVESYQPRGAEQFLLQHTVHDNLFNIIRDGSYFAWRVADRTPIFIDGRTDAYPQELYREFDALTPRTWNAFANKHAINTAVIPARQYEDLAQHLFSSPDWALVHLDATSYLFLRNTPVNEPIIAKTRIDPQRFTPPATEPDDRVPAWKSAYGGVGRAWYNAGMANALATLGGHAAAIPYYEKAVANAPTITRYKLALAPYYIVSGKGVEAERLLEGVSHAQLTDVDLTTAQLLTEAGQLQAALAPALRVLEARPNDHQVRILVADLQFRTGDFAKARDNYTTALKAGAGSYHELNKLAHAHAQTGNLEEAARAYRASLDGEPRQPAIWTMAGEVVARMGDLRGAKQCFENALRLNPDSQQARQNLEQVNQLLANPQPSQPPQAPHQP